jgi:sulfur dioxygenase
MIFRQLFEPLSSTYTYLVGCEETGNAVLIDPVMNAIERDLGELQKYRLKLIYTVDTHVHADHITSALELKKRVKSQIAASAIDALPCVDQALVEGTPLRVGSVELRPLHTPGHTDGHFAYALDDRVFTGDALLIDGCGRTDFQNGDARTLYRSVTEKLFSLGDHMLVYPGHDYQKRRVSTIAQEKDRNPRLGQQRDMESFVQVMANLKLPYPKFIDYALPGNRACGVCPEGLPEELKAYCDRMSASLQG